ncbi:MAG: acyl-CoA thioesterase [Dorea sp.]|nr:acyl-CoA thioesterase [Dorea sp.]
MAEERRVSDSVVETVHIVRPNHLNNSGRLFGGILMQWIDEVGALTAKRHCRKNVTTVSVDKLHFIKGAYPKDDIVIKGKLTHVGNTSMEVKVDTYVEDENGERTLINRAYLTEVALGHDDRPVRVPRLILETEEERQEWLKAEKRRELRKLQKAGGF